MKLPPMIAHLRGILLEKHPHQAILECGGVGYDVAIPVSTYTALPDSGREAQLRIHTHVREDALSLFGFATAAEKQLFEKLLSVSGIGPKLALTVLSGLVVDDLIYAIRSGDLTRLTKIPGVGKKTAERMVLELRDKLEGGTPAKGVAGSITPLVLLTGVEGDVVSALENLGSKRDAAEAAVKKARAAGTEEVFEALFRKALEMLR
jgi:holliday junction DNA helicase RuvA